MSGSVTHSEAAQILLLLMGMGLPVVLTAQQKCIPPPC